MNLKLIRNNFDEDGIFGALRDPDGNLVAVTLEHSYDLNPKIPPGQYTCMRGSHRLHSMTQDFETFEITDVPGHSNILFHCGNKNADSEGCVLLGLAKQSFQDGDQIVDSRAAFAKFMTLQTGVDEFVLEVSNP